jgi:hypothetical protein
MWKKLQICTSKYTPSYKLTNYNNWRFQHKHMLTKTVHWQHYINFWTNIISNLSISKIFSFNHTQINHIWTNAQAQQSHFGSMQVYYMDHKPIYIFIQIITLRPSKFFIMKLKNNIYLFVYFHFSHLLNKKNLHIFNSKKAHHYVNFCLSTNLYHHDVLLISCKIFSQFQFVKLFKYIVKLK